MFYQKNGWIIVKLSRDLINMEVGDRIPPFAQYEEVFDSGRGTIQRAVKFLLDNKCMTLEKQGPKGTFITSLNYERLWTYSDWGNLLGAIPVPTGDTIPALVTAIHTTLKANKIPFDFVYMIAAHNRLRELANNRYHFALTTRLAMNVTRELYPELKTVAELTGCIYSTPYALFHHQDKFDGVKDGMSIVVNARSVEQSYISDLVCKGKKVRRMEMTHQESSRAFVNGKADILIARPALVHLNGSNIKYESLEYLGLDVDSTTPVIVANEGNYGMIQLLRKKLPVSGMSNIQSQVLAGLLEPSFF